MQIPIEDRGPAALPRTVVKRLAVSRHHPLMVATTSAGSVLLYDLRAPRAAAAQLKPHSSPMVRPGRPHTACSFPCRCTAAQSASRQASVQCVAWYCLWCKAAQVVTHVDEIARFGFQVGMAVEPGGLKDQLVTAAADGELKFIDFRVLGEGNTAGSSGGSAFAMQPPAGSGSGSSGNMQRRLLSLQLLICNE